MRYIKMDTTIMSLLVSQIITFLLLVISETMPLSNSRYSGIIHALITSLEKIQPILEEEEIIKPVS